MYLLFILDFFAEVFHLIFQLGLLTRKYVVPALVFAYVAVEHYIVPAFSIPQNYLHVRRARLLAECAT